MNISVILPSLDPDEKLVQVVDGLILEGFKDIVIVNDGSDEAHMEPFRQVEHYPEVTLLHHKVNKGKGRALKTAFSYCAQNRRNIDGVVTVDGDNQHLPRDIKACCEKMEEEPDKMILGCRDFSGEDVPPKSRFGNNLTKGVFRFACGIRISDTQTGLRVIPAKYLEFMVQIPGERFEYETQMLLETKKRRIEFQEVKIETVYIDDNATTHFHPIRDSLKIYGVIFKYLLGSILSFVIDISLFTVILLLVGDTMDNAYRIMVATAGARVISSIFNFSYNRRAVFEHKDSVAKSMLKYYTLCICQMGMSYGLVYLISLMTSANSALTSVIKVFVDVTLFIVSFQIQRRWVFVHEHKEEIYDKEGNRNE